MRVLSGVKRASANHAHKNSTKRSYLSESQSSVTHTGSPVNPMTAKALASKLNERNSLLNGTKKATQGQIITNGTANDIPVPPLISIQTAAATNRFKDGHESHPNTFSQVKHANAKVDANCKHLTNEKSHKSTMSSKQFNGTNTAQHSKSVNHQHFIGVLISPIKFYCHFYRHPGAYCSHLLKCINVNFVRKNSIRYVNVIVRLYK